MKSWLERTATRAFLALSATALRIRLALTCARRALGEDAEPRLWVALIGLILIVSVVNGLRAAGLIG
jgi:hypothetical protein